MSPVQVMIVDDEISFVHNTVKRLSRSDLQVLAAHNGREALEILSGYPDVDIVILKVDMADMSAIDTLKRIKMSHPLVEVIMLTEPSSMETVIECMRLGAYDYLLKPCDMSKVISTVAAAAARKAGQDEKIVEAQMRGIALAQIP